jgi:hypothetical protein
MDIIKIRHQQLFGKQDNACASGIWQLPVETLSEIFVHCLPADDFWVSPRLAPILLTRICQRWRDVVVNMPIFWCRLFVVVSHKVVDWKNSAFLYDLWLQRSRKRPLSLTLHCCPDGSARLRNLLDPYTAQIASLQVIVDRHTIIPDFPFKDLPGLQDLMLYWQTVHCDETAFERSFSHLPSTLHNLKLKGELVNSFKMLSTCNLWDQLTNVETRVKQPRDLLDLLHRCPNLSSLEICLDFKSAAMKRVEHFTHTSLQSLAFSCSGSAVLDSLPKLFNAFTLPNLRVLEVRYVSSPWPHDELKAFMERSNSTMECLIFGDGVSMTDEDEEHYLALIPSLKVVWDPTRSGHYGS